MVAECELLQTDLQDQPKLPTQNDLKREKLPNPQARPKTLLKPIKTRYFFPSKTQDQAPVPSDAPLAIWTRSRRRTSKVIPSKRDRQVQPNPIREAELKRYRDSYHIGNGSPECTCIPSLIFPEKDNHFICSGCGKLHLFDCPEAEFDNLEEYLYLESPERPGCCECVSRIRFRKKNQPNLEA